MEARGAGTEVRDTQWSADTTDSVTKSYRSTN